MAAVPQCNGKAWPGGVQAAVFAPGGSDAIFVVDGRGGVTAWDLRRSAQPSPSASAADDATGEKIRSQTIPETLEAGAGQNCVPGEPSSRDTPVGCLSPIIRFYIPSALAPTNVTSSPRLCPARGVGVAIHPSFHQALSTAGSFPRVAYRSERLQTCLLVGALADLIGDYCAPRTSWESVQHLLLSEIDMSSFLGPKLAPCKFSPTP